MYSSDLTHEADRTTSAGPPSMYEFVVNYIPVFNPRG